MAWPTRCWIDVTPNAKIFCNSPWYELQIYWDGSLGFCCQEAHKIYPEAESAKYNIRNMSISEWMDSEPMRQARLSMFGNEKNSFCVRCYNEEDHSGTSRRNRSNQKSVIFQRNFQESYDQGPGRNKFESSRVRQGHHADLPVDLHIDLGNYCNLTCKMCNPRASSSIAVQHVRWGMTDAQQYVGTDWTRDTDLWQRTLRDLANIPRLKNVHFMGGETLLTPRFEEFLDFMIAQNRLDINISFVTNGTHFIDRIMPKLARFRGVNIEVSIESLTQHNAYQRQGTNTDQVMRHVKRYLDLTNEQISLTVRPAISALTIGTYHTLLAWCLQNNVVVKSLLCTHPQHLSVVILPGAVKKHYSQKYHDFMARYDLESLSVTDDYNASDRNEIKKIIKNQVLQCLSVLATPRPEDADACLEQMVYWCQRWDRVHGLDARILYPELEEVFNLYHYDPLPQ